MTRGSPLGGAGRTPRLNPWNVCHFDFPGTGSVEIRRLDFLPRIQQNGNVIFLYQQ